MNGARASIAGVLGAALALGGAAAVLRARETTRPLPPSNDRLLYLTSGKTARRVVLSFDSLAADVYWMRAIQHYGRDRKAPASRARFELLQPLLDLTTTLDPHFNIAYRFGAIFLSLDPPDGPGRTDQAIALLNKGLAANPSRWQYAHDIGFIYYWYAGDYRQAANWFERASTMPGAPSWIAPLAAVMLAQGGDRQAARRLLMELRSASEPYIQRTAERSLAQFDALDAIDVIQSVVERFRAQTGRYPTGLAELIRAGMLRGAEDPTGVPFAYDAERHVVSLSSESTLMPLPRAMGNR